jgi:hypothetical protein
LERQTRGSLDQVRLVGLAHFTVGYIFTYAAFFNRFHCWQVRLNLELGN